MLFEFHSSERGDLNSAVQLAAPPCPMEVKVEQMWLCKPLNRRNNRGPGKKILITPRRKDGRNK